VGERRAAYRVSVEKLNKRNHLEDPVVGGRIILKWISETWDEGMDRIDLAQDRDKWRVPVNKMRETS
jgi:hypothetical protein